MKISANGGRIISFRLDNIELITNKVRMKILVQHCGQHRKEICAGRPTPFLKVKNIPLKKMETLLK